jgi:hypothetical protein
LFQFLHDLFRHRVPAIAEAAPPRFAPEPLRRVGISKDGGQSREIVFTERKDAVIDGSQRHLSRSRGIEQVRDANANCNLVSGR